MVGTTHDQTVIAQEELNALSDSLKIEVPVPQVGSQPPQESIPTSVYSGYEHIGPYTRVPLAVNPAAFTLTYHSHWTDNLSGYTATLSMPGLMGVDAGVVQYNWNVGNLRFTPEVFVNRYGWFRGVTTQYDAGGTLSFDFNPTFSITLFGSYASYAWAPNPAVLSNMATSRFGGFLTWNINDYWGVDIGAQRVRNGMSGQWETIPIMMPYYKLGKAKIGIDAGSILHEVLRDNRHSNPTMGPPIDTTIRIPPRN